MLRLQGGVLRILEGLLVYALALVFLILWLSLRRQVTAPLGDH